MIQDYDNQGTLLGSYRDPAFFDDRNYPQYLPGTARTFVLEEGIAIITYSSVQPGKKAFLKTYFCTFSRGYGSVEWEEWLPDEQQLSFQELRSEL